MNKSINKKMNFIPVIAVSLILLIGLCACSGNNNITANNNDTSKFKENCDTYAKEYLEPELVSVDNEGVTYKIKCTNNTEDKDNQTGIPKYTQIEIKYFDYDGQKSYLNNTNKDNLYPTNYKVYSNEKENLEGILTYYNKEEEAYIRYKKTDITNVEDYKKLKVYFNLTMNRTSAWDGKNKLDTFQNLYFSVK